jgi:hypothetical protein
MFWHYWPYPDKRNPFGDEVPLRALMLIIAVSPVLSLRAQTPIPALVQQGLDSLTKGSCQGAFDLWTRGWPDVQKAQMAPTCSALQEYGGAFRGYDVLKTVDVTPHLTRVYIMLLYQIQPVYMMVVLYRPGEVDWKVSSVNWHTDPDKVIPSSILPPQRPAQ